MLAVTEPGVTAVAAAPLTAPTPARHTIEPRAVESTEQPSLRAHHSLFASSQAILELLRNSAEQFSQLLETVGDVNVAGAMAGFQAPPPAVGAAFDEYA